LVSVSTHAPLHVSVPLGQLPIMQALPWQISPAPQAVPQAPQWSELLARFTQLPAHVTSGDTHSTGGFCWVPFSAGVSPLEQAPSQDMDSTRELPSTHRSRERSWEVCDRAGEWFMVFIAPA
jgi:hypothetical protein